MSSPPHQPVGDIMAYLHASQILLWLVFLAQAVAILALARQVGVLHERIAPAGALTLHQTLKAGDEAPRHSVIDFWGRPYEIGGVCARSQLIMFVSPDCPICKSLLPIVKSAAAAERSWLDVVFASDGDEAEHRDFAERYGLKPFGYLLSERLGRSFQVSKLPYGVLIDEAGKVAALGVLNSREHLESLFEAKRHKVASLQDFYARRASADLQPQA